MSHHHHKHHHHGGHHHGGHHHRHHGHHHHGGGHHHHSLFGHNHGGLFDHHHGIFAHHHHGGHHHGHHHHGGHHHHVDICEPPRRNTITTCSVTSSAPRSTSTIVISPTSTCTTPALPITKEGFLTKQGAWIRNWKRRWFILRGKTLSYHVTRLTTMAQGSISLVGARLIKNAQGHPYSINSNLVFAIQCHTRTYFIEADTHTDYLEWTTILDDVMNNRTPSNVIQTPQVIVQSPYPAYQPPQQQGMYVAPVYQQQQPVYQQQQPVQQPVYVAPSTPGMYVNYNPTAPPM